MHSTTILVDPAKSYARHARRLGSASDGVATSEGQGRREGAELPQRHRGLRQHPPVSATEPTRKSSSKRSVGSLEVVLPVPETNPDESGALVEAVRGPALRQVPGATPMRYSSYHGEQRSPGPACSSPAPAEAFMFLLGFDA